MKNPGWTCIRLNPTICGPRLMVQTVFSHAILPAKVRPSGERQIHATRSHFGITGCIRALSQKSQLKTRKNLLTVQYHFGESVQRSIPALSEQTLPEAFLRGFSPLRNFQVLRSRETGHVSDTALIRTWGIPLQGNVALST